MKWISKPGLLIKVVLFLLLAAALYWQVFHKVDLDRLIIQFRENVKGDTRAILLLSLASFLMLVNWGLESFKWKLLISRLQIISLAKSFRAVLSGVTLGIFTPNRIGEYAGRIWYLEKDKRLAAVVATLVGSFSQIIATFIMGVLALLIFLPKFYDLGVYLYVFILFISILLIIIFLLLYFNLDVLLKFLNHFGFLRKFSAVTAIAGEFNYRELSLVLLLSIFRFSVFTAQYLILFIMFGLTFSIVDGFVVIGMIFFVQTIVPSFAVAELLTRSNIAVFFVSFYFSNELGVIAASTTLWLLNLIVPAIAGLFFTSRINLFRNNKEL